LDGHVKIDIWLDLVCPFCYLGRHRFEAALTEFAHRDDLDVRWHSYELDRHAPAVATDTLPEHLSAKYGMPLADAEAAQERLARDFEEYGLAFNWREAKRGNTFDAHRLVHLGQDHGVGTELVERFMRGYFSEGEAIGDRDTLVKLAVDAGLPEADVRTAFDSDELGSRVRTDEALAGQIGIQGVPFFVFDERLGLSGAQPPAVFTQALNQAWDTKDEAREYAGGGCGGDCCGGACGQ
jgi:predicted DsbA family dithiol-disulfide isomerase